MLIAVGTNFSARATTVDTCATVTYRGELATDFLGIGPHPSDGWDTIRLADPQIVPAAVVFIVNGNSHGPEHYTSLATHLARYGYAVRIVMRNGGALEVDTVRASIPPTLAHLGLSPDFPVVLIGHSMGGGSVIETVRLYSGEFNIRAVVSIAPNVENVLGGFLGSQARAYLALYGSQDEDMTGTSGSPREAFAAYDRVGIETTTASHFSRYFAVSANAMDKAMVYVNGADHSGLVGDDGEKLGAEHFDYLAIGDQFCITKAYVAAFLEWQVRGESGYRPMFRGELVPPSVASIVTAEQDYAGNAAGSALRLHHQFSPRKRYVVADFSSSPTLTVGADVFASVVYPFSVDALARHYTMALMMRWRSNMGQRKLEISVPANRRNLAAFDQLQLRIGQLRSGDPTTANIAQQEPPLVINLVDGQGGSVARLLNAYGHIPGADRKSGGPGLSHMNTISIPMSEFDTIDLTDVRYIRFWVMPGTRGEVMIDNIEASYDY